ncbi:MAG: alpha-ketoacid dehydrogenase subunit beta, partial [Lactiplantibacillus argentoratensis]
MFLRNNHKTFNNKLRNSKQRSRSNMSKKTYIQAITDALRLELGSDEKTLVFGEDVGKNGGVFRATDGL